MVLAGYDANGARVISWGQYYTMTWAFFAKYVDEVYAIADNDLGRRQGHHPRRPHPGRAGGADAGAAGGLTRPPDLSRSPWPRAIRPGCAVVAEDRDKSSSVCSPGVGTWPTRPGVFDILIVAPGTWISPASASGILTSISRSHRCGSRAACGMVLTGATGISAASRVETMWSTVFSAHHLATACLRASLAPDPAGEAVGAGAVVAGGDAHQPGRHLAPRGGDHDMAVLRLVGRPAALAALLAGGEIVRERDLDHRERRNRAGSNRRPGPRRCGRGGARRRARRSSRATRYSGRQARWRRPMAFRPARRSGSSARSSPGPAGRRPGGRDRGRTGRSPRPRSG